MGSDTACHAAVESHVFVKHMASLDVFWKMLQEDSVKCGVQGESMSDL